MATRSCRGRLKSRSSTTGDRADVVAAVAQRHEPPARTISVLDATVAAGMVTVRARGSWASSWIWR